MLDRVGAGTSEVDPPSDPIKLKSAESTPNADAMRGSPPLSELIKAVDAMNSIAPYVSGHVSAQRLLIDRVKHGKIQAFALRTWVTKDFNPGRATSWNTPEEALKKVQIKRIWIRGAKQLEQDICQWNWNIGRFFLLVAARPQKWRVFRDVRFLRNDVADLETELKAEYPGGRKQSDLWIDFWLTVVEMARDGALDPAKVRDQTVLLSDVKIQLGWHKKAMPPLSDPSLSEPIRRIFHRIVQKPTNETGIISTK